MDKTATERLTQWLRDAHTMETEAETMLKALSSRIENYPELRQRIDQHVEETRNQARRIEARLEAMDSSPSSVKDTAASAMASLHAGGNAMMSDEVVKGLGMAYAFEHMEIISYRNLMYAAEQYGDSATAELCRQIIPEEEAMADWLARHQQTLVQQFLGREQTDGATAKH